MSKTIILSDCHIGSNESNYRLVNKFLRHLTCDRLVLLGDFWDIWDMSPDMLRERYGDTIAHLRALLARDTKIEFILGNHDEDYVQDPVMPLSEIPVLLAGEVVTTDGRRIGLCHGHEFDPIFKRWYKLSRLLAWVNRAARRLLGMSAKSFKKKTCTDLEGKEYSKTVEKIHAKARKTYMKLGFSGLIMGHTHAPTYQTSRGGPMDFYNAGDWKWSNTYIEINDGHIELKHFHEECDKGR